MKLFYENDKDVFIYEPNEDDLIMAIDYVLTFKSKEYLINIIKILMNNDYNCELLREDLTEYFEKTAKETQD